MYTFEDKTALIRTQMRSDKTRAALVKSTHVTLKKYCNGVSEFTYSLLPFLTVHIITRTYHILRNFFVTDNFAKV